MNIYKHTVTCLTAMLLSANCHAQLANGNYYIQNAATKTYIAGANTYGTHASITPQGQVLTLTATDEDTYTINTYMFGSDTDHYLGSNLFMNSKKTEWILKEVSSGHYLIMLDEKNCLGYDGMSTSLKLMSSKELSAEILWKIISEDERIHSINPKDDVTFLIKDADFSVSLGPQYGGSYWNIGDATDSSAISLSSGLGTDNCGNANRTTFDVYQVLEGVPNGTYTLTAQGFYRDLSNVSSYKPELYIQDESEEFFPASGNEGSVNEACSSFRSKKYQIPEIEAKTNDGTLRIGVRLERNTGLWCFWDKMKLTYVSDLSLSEYKSALKKSVKQAETLNDKLMNSGIRDSLDTMLANSANLNNSFDAYKSFVSELNRLIANAKTSISNYDKFIAAYESFLDLDDAGIKFYRESAQELLSSYENGSLTEREEEILALDSIHFEAYKMQITSGTDMTRLIVNPTIDGTEGWTCEKPNGGNGPMLKEHSFEYWAGEDIDEDDRTFNYYQTLTGLQNGVYIVSCDAYNSMNGTASEYNTFTPTCGIYARSGSKTVRTYVDKDSEKLTTYTTPEIKVTDGTLMIGVRNFNTMAARWFVADNFRLTLIEPDEAVGISGQKSEGIVSGDIISINGSHVPVNYNGTIITKTENGVIKRIVK